MVDRRLAIECGLILGTAALTWVWVSHKWGGDNLPNHQMPSTDSPVSAPTLEGDAHWTLAINQRLDELARGQQDILRAVSVSAREGLATEPRSTANAELPQNGTPVSKADLEVAVSALRLELHSLRATFEKQVWVSRPPTFEQLSRVGRRANWLELAQFLQKYANNPDVAKSEVRLRSYDEILDLFGAPPVIEPAVWWYPAGSSGGLTKNGVKLDFVNGYVGGITVYQAASKFEWARKLLPGSFGPRINLAITLERAGRKVVSRSFRTFGRELVVRAQVGCQ